MPASAPRIARIEAQDCLPLRREVLWPGKSLVECAVPGDAEGLHYGAFEGERLVCVASFFLLPAGEARLRKFATLPSHQRRGIGSRLLARACAELRAQGVERLWFDARVAAEPFYRRLGFAAEGRPFAKQGLDYLRMAGRLDALPGLAATGS